MNKLPAATRAAILRSLTDGASIRATCRVTGASMGAVLRLLEEAGKFAAVYCDHMLRNLPTTRAEIDEAWSYVGAKQKNAKHSGQGDLWTFCAIDSDSKLVFSWLVGARSPENAADMVADAASRLKNRVQLTTDGHNMYIEAVRQAFAFGRVDYARLVKTYGMPFDADAQRRYSPPACTGAVKERMIGRPVQELVSTSYVERLNLTTRMNCRRMTRLTNGFSKKAANHAHAIALQFFTYNFCRTHGTLTKAAGVKTTPAMAAGVIDHVLTLDEVIGLMDPAVSLH